jgi:hypothetical protein
VAAFVVLLCVCVCMCVCVGVCVCVWLGLRLLDDDLVEVETCRRNISDKLLLSPDCAIDLFDQLLNNTS